LNLLEQLEAAPSLDALDDAALAHTGYWTDAERDCYERRARQFLGLAMLAPNDPDSESWVPWPPAMDEQFTAGIRIVIQGVHDEHCYWGFALRGDDVIAFHKSLSVAKAFNRLAEAIQGGA
jgi:hypothetical protein